MTNDDGMPKFELRAASRDEFVIGGFGIQSSFVIRHSSFPSTPSPSRFDVPNPLVAPTILRILGITPPEARDGRVLLEALAAVDWDAPKPETKTVEATTKGWRQYLKLTTLGDRTYLDEGNAER